MHSPQIDSCPIGREDNIKPLNCTSKSNTYNNQEPYINHFTPITIKTNRYPHQHDLSRLDSRRPPSQILPSISGILHITIVEALKFTSHPDRELVSYIIRGLQDGFRIGFNRGTPLRSAASNMPSTSKNPEVVVAYLLKELQEKRVLGPLPPAKCSRDKYTPIVLE